MQTRRPKNTVGKFFPTSLDIFTLLQLTHAGSTAQQARVTPGQAAVTPGQASRATKPAAAAAAPAARGRGSAGRAPLHTRTAHSAAAPASPALGSHRPDADTRISKALRGTSALMGLHSATGICVYIYIYT